MMLYLLDDDKNPVHIDDPVTWGRGFEKLNRFVARDEVDGVAISTVFLGIDHSFLGIGPPILWETMIFGGPMNHEMWRYSSLQDALDGHASVLEKVRNQENA
jgi:hypothetical protein